MNYVIHAAPVFTSLRLRCFSPIVITIATTAVFILLLLLLYYYCRYTTVATDKLHQVSCFPGVADLTNQLLRLIIILWLPLCRIDKFGFYFPRRLYDPLYLWVITSQAGAAHEVILLDGVNDGGGALHRAARRAGPAREF